MSASGSSPRAHRRAQILVAQQRLGDLVELQVAAAGLGERAQLRHVDLHYIVEELLEVGIHGRVHAGAAARIVQVRRRGQGRLYRLRGLQQRECHFVGDDRPSAADLRRRDRRRADARHVAGVVALQVDLAHRIGAGEPGCLGHEAQAPRLAAELAVGHHLQTEALLPADHALDGFVFPSFDQIRRPQQAADVLGLEWRCRGQSGLRPFRFDQL